MGEGVMYGAIIPILPWLVSLIIPDPPEEESSAEPESGENTAAFLGIGPQRGGEQQKSYLKNCFVMATKDQEGEMFTIHEDGAIIARLDGYAIIPIEQYRRLVEEE